MVWNLWVLSLHTTEVIFINIELLWLLIIWFLNANSIRKQIRYLFKPFAFKSPWWLHFWNELKDPHVTAHWQNGSEPISINYHSTPSCDNDDLMLAFTATMSTIKSHTEDTSWLAEKIIETSNYHSTEAASHVFSCNEG